MVEDSKSLVTILGARRQDRKSRKVVFVMCLRPPSGPEKPKFRPDDVPIEKRLPFFKLQTRLQTHWMGRYRGVYGKLRA